MKNTKMSMPVGKKTATKTKMAPKKGMASKKGMGYSSKKMG